nr:hypothetical protein [Tanacetum cinerariifolium]
ELEKNLVTYSPNFQNTFEPSNASTNVVNDPREPYVVKQDNGSFVDKIIVRAPDSPDQFHCFHCKDVLRAGEACKRCTCAKCGSGIGKGLCYICGHNQNSFSPSISETSSQCPSNISHFCYECGDPLDGIFYKQCTCKFCGKDAHIGYNCPSKVPVLLLAWDRVFEIKDALGNKQYKSEDIKELFLKLLDDLKNIHEELAEYINTPGWNRPPFYDDDDDDDEESSNSLKDNIISELPPCVAITPTEPVDSLSMGDEHLDTIPVTESDECINSSVENLVPNPSESEGENECDVPAGFTTFSNVLFDAEYDIDSSDDQSFSDEDLPKKIYSIPFFDEEIIPMKIDPHSFNAESDLIESMPHHDSSIIISSKIDSLFDEFAGELTLLKSIPLEIDETDCHPEEETHFTKRLLYDNSSPRLLEEFVSENSNVDIESFSPSPIPIKDSDSHMEEIDLSFNPDDPMPPGIEEDDDDSKRDIPILEELLDNYSLSLPEIESFHFDIPLSYRPPAKPPDGNT